MAWPKPAFSRKAIQRAGETLISGTFNLEEFSKAFEILTNWRACHGYPVNTFNVTLRDKLDRLTSDYLVAQRLKRWPSILAKLKRFPGMSLARMQDIGGLRAVVDSVSCAERVRESYRKSKFAHELVADTDYIASPKDSGYRGFHMVYKYKGSHSQDYDGLQLELQIRTRVQHAWATAVETAGTFLNQSLKSSEGPDRWLDFFSLVSAGFALREQCPVGERWRHLSEPRIQEKIRAQVDDIGIVEKLSTFRKALNSITNNNHRGTYYLIVLDPAEQTVSVAAYSKQRLDEANADYSRYEKGLEKESARQVVLVSASSLDQLRRAYPNYFLDTQEFLNMLSDITGANNTMHISRR